MIRLETALSNDTGAYVFHTNAEGELWVRLSGTFAGTITMQEKPDGGSWSTFSPDGTDATFTAAGHHMYHVPGGCNYRFVSANGSDSVNIDVAGRGRANAA